MAAFVSGHCILGGLLIMSFLTSNGIGIGDIELIFILQLCTSIKFVATTVLIAVWSGNIKPSISVSGFTFCSLLKSRYRYHFDINTELDQLWI